MGRPYLIYLATSGLGENLMATAAMDYLSKTYLIVFLTRPDFATLFRRFPFIHQVIAVENYQPHSLKYQWPEEITRMVADKFSPGWVTSHFDKVVDSFTQFSGLSEKFQTLKKTDAPLAATPRMILQRLGISSENLTRDLIKFRRPYHSTSRDSKKRIVLYQGSYENLRRLGSNEFNTFQKRLAEYAKKGFEIHCIHSRHYAEGIERFPHCIYLETERASEKLDLILNLFSSGVDLMIGPDSGLTNLAHCFEIPMIWLESRERIEMIVDPIYYGHVHHYRKLDSDCTRECRAAKFVEEYGHAPRIVRLNPKGPFKDLQFLPCFHDKQNSAPCLKFSQEDYNKIFALVDKQLFTNGSGQN